MTIEDIKSLMKSGDVAGAEAAAQELLTAEPDNDQAMMLYGTCRQLQGDEATFRDTYWAVKEHLKVRSGLPDEETQAAWKRFEMLYGKLVTTERHKPVVMEYVVIAVLIAAAAVTGIVLWGRSISDSFNCSTAAVIYEGHTTANVDYNNYRNRQEADCAAKKFTTDESSMGE